MRGIIVVVEGKTEEEFVNQVLASHFFNLGAFDIRATQIRTSEFHKGGHINYDHFKKRVFNLLHEQHDMIVTSLIDYFRLPSNTPDYAATIKLPTSLQKVEAHERSILRNIDNHRFIPYIQLHEFEGLLFSDNKGFDAIADIANIPDASRKKLDEIVEQNKNPELINDKPDTHPSQRLKNLIPEYEKNKPLYGHRIAAAIGIETMLDRCPRFSRWIQTLKEKMNP